jgi:hypothetical protein
MRSLKCYLDDLFELVLFAFIICAVITALGLTGCAASVDKDKSGDLQNENTNLKIQITQLKLEHKQTLESNAGMSEALKQCYKK